MQKPQQIFFQSILVFNNEGNLVFSQRFSSVESEASSNRQPILSDEELTSIFKGNILPPLSSPSPTQFSFQISKSLYIVVLPTKNFYLGVIPLIRPTSVQPYIEVSASYSFLSFLETVTRSILKTMNPNSPPSAYASFRQLINQILPFGSPIVHDAYFASQLISPGDLRRFSAGYQVVAPSPIPSWKVSLLFSRPQIELKLREVIFGSIDGQNNTYTVYGELKSVASINYLPDITAKVKGLENVLDLSGHYCVKKIEKDQIVFSPPTGVAQLLLWKSNVDPTKPPVDGIYEIFEDEVGLHFSLTITVKENVKTVTAQLPFPGRSSLTKHQFQNPGGQLKMSKKEATVMWLAKFSEQKSLTLTGILNFESNESTSKERCRAYISFKSKKKSFTGIEVEKDSVTFNPSGNVNVTTELSYTTENKKYIFWATQGNH